jgi:hypothetical protein
MDKGLPPPCLREVVLNTGQGDYKALIITLLKYKLTPEEVLNIGRYLGHHSPEVFY